MAVKWQFELEQVAHSFPFWFLMNSRRYSIYAIFWAVLPCLLVGCSPRVSYYHPVVGADQFVCDSHRIGQGKQAILEMRGDSVGSLTPEDFEEYRDLIVEGDLLQLNLYHPKREDLVQSIEKLCQSLGGFCVVDGAIQLPDLSPIQVAGCTLDEAKESIESALKQHLQEVKVFLSYRERSHNKVELNGLVGVPFLPVDGKMRLYELLGKARIAPQANLFMSYVVRDGMPLAIDLHRLLNGGDMSQNIVMRPGDKVFLANPADANVLVMGEVRSSQIVAVPYGSIPLRQALVAAGGIPYTGDRNQIYVIRGDLACPKIYHLCWNQVLQLPNEALLLMPGDTVYVVAKPIAEWNRFIEQLLPSFRCFGDGHGCYEVICQ